MIRRGFSHPAEAFDDALAGRARGPLDAEMRDLVETAELLCRSSVAEPSPEFSTALRARLMAEAGDVLVAAHSSTTTTPEKIATRTGARRRVAGVTAALVAGVGTVGLVSSSATAVPGDVLYPVKRGVENVQVALHRDPASRGEYRLQQARERLAEAVALEENGETARIAGTFETFSEQVDSGSSDLFDAYRDDAAPQTITTVNDFIAAASVDLAAMAPSMPEEAYAAWASASETVTSLADSAATLCTSCDVADVASLTDLVQTIVGGEAATSTDEPDAAPAPADSSPQQVPSGDLPSIVPSAGVPTVKVPRAPSATSTPPNVVGDTVDDLLGEDGLVPGIVGGLLGQPKK